MPRINKIKRTKAIGALRKAGMSYENAVRHVSYLDLEEAFGPQIEELAEDFPDLFEPATDEDDTDATEDDDRPMTAHEAMMSRLRGEHIERKTYRRTAEERPSTASKAAQDAAAHLTQGLGNNKPPTRKWYTDGPRDLNANGSAQPPRQRPASADVLAAKLRGN